MIQPCNINDSNEAPCSNNFLLRGKLKMPRGWSSRASVATRILGWAGLFALIAVAATSSVTEMDEVIDRIGALEGVERTTSSIILSTKFER